MANITVKALRSLSCIDVQLTSQMLLHVPFSAVEKWIDMAEVRMKIGLSSW